MHLTFGKKLNFFDNNEQGFLYARGFMNRSILINTSTRCKTQSQFIILPKIINQQLENQHIKFNNTPVLFGAQICIKHLESDCYVKATGQTLENLNGFSLQLSNIFGEECIFKILPLRTFQHQGQPITLDSIFCIKNQNLQTFLNVDSESIISQQPFNQPHYILRETQYLKFCKLSFDKSSLWTFCFKSMQQYEERKYLSQNDYIYFIHSKDDAVLSVNRQNTEIVYQMGYENDQELYQNLWEVDYHLDHKTHTQQMRLKHIRSGKYFDEKGMLKTEATKITLVPLLEVENRLPPFSIFANQKCYTRSLAGEDQNFHGFQINTVNKKPVKTLLSIKGVKPNVWIPYLINYLKDGNISAKQRILREFQCLTILLDLIKSKRYPDMNTLAYKLLYLVCEGNINNKKRCCESSTLQFILNDKQKQDTSQLLRQLLSTSYDIDVIQTQITPQRIEMFIRQYCLPENTYKVPHMKIIRSFCGTYKKQNKRNQSIIFGYFFPVEKLLSIVNPLTETKYPGKFEIPKHYKMRFRRNQAKKIVIVSFVDNKEVEESPPEISKQKLTYYRQYLYLIAKCMKQRHEANIHEFTQQFPLDVLCQVLFNADFYYFKEPVLEVINTAYIDVDPYSKCQFNFIGRESQIASKGYLISILLKDSLLFKVLDFIKSEILIPPDYQSTYILILLQNLRLTIQQGFWKEMQDILVIKKHLMKIIFQQDIEYSSDQKYQTMKNNLTTAKIIAVDIYKSILDVQINLWVSQLLFIDGQDSINQTIDKWFYSKHFEWGLDRNLFNLAAQTNPTLLQNSLQLFYRLFNVKKQIYSQLQQAKLSKSLGDLKSSEDLLSPSHNRQKKFSNLAKRSMFSEFDSIHEIVQFLVEEENKFTKQQLIIPFDYFLPLFQYKKTNKYYQNLAQKFGLHSKATTQILKFNINNIRSKNCSTVAQYFYLLVAMIKDNSNNKAIISQQRKQLMKFVQVNSLSFIVCQFIQQLYKNNKAMITNLRQIESVCNVLLKCLSSLKTDNITFATCKILNLLEMLIILRHKTIEMNKNIIINQILKKQFANVLEITNSDNLKNNKKNDAVVLYDIIIFSLMSSLNQPSLKKKFINKYQLKELIFLLSIIKSNNWLLKSKVRLYINESNFLNNSENRIQIMMTNSEDMNLMLKSLSSKTPPCEQQMSDFQSNLKEIVKSFKLCLLKINSIHEQISAAENQICVKNYERIVIIKNHCSLDLSNEIDTIGKYFNKIWSKITVAGQSLENKLFFSLLQSMNIQLHRELFSEKAGPIIEHKLTTQSQKSQQPAVQQDKFNYQSLISKIVQYSGKIEDKPDRNYVYEQIYDLEQSTMDNLVSNILEKNDKDTTIFSNQIKMFIASFLIECLIQPFKSNGIHITNNFWFSELPKQKATQLFKQRQQMFIQYQIPKLVCSFLSESFQQRYSLYNNVLELGICLLFDGHSKFQQNFMAAFKLDRKNIIFTSLVTINNETLRNIEFFYTYQGKALEGQKQSYPGFIKYELIIDKSEVDDCRVQRRDSCNLISKIFRFLQLLCENNNKLMKSYIQNQIDSTMQVKYTSVSFIEEANKTLWKIFSITKQNLCQLRKFQFQINDDFHKRELFQGFKKQIQDNLCFIPVMILQFLIEVCQTPNQSNQLYLCRTNFFEIILEMEHLMNDLGTQFVDTFTILKQGTIYPIFFIYQRKIVVLIRSLLQSSDPTIIGLLQKNFTNRQFQFLLVESMRYGGVAEKEKLEQIMKQFTMKDELTNIISLLVIKKILKKDITDKVNQQSIIQLQSRIRSIEVNFHGKTLVVYFPSHLLFDYLPIRTKDWILYQYFELRSEKLKNMLGLRTIVYQQMEYQCKVNNQIINQKTIGVLFNIALLFSYLIIGLLVLFYSVSSRKLKLDIIEVRVVFWASSIQFLLSLTYFMLWGLLRAPLTLRRIQRYREKYHQVVKHTSLKDKILKDYLHLIKITYTDNPNSIEVLVFLLISIFGVVFDPRWFAFNVFYLFTKLDVLKNIFSALTKNFKQMLVVCLFGGAFIFVFALITLNSYLAAIYENQQIDIDISKEGQHCVSLVSCIVSLYTQQIIGEASPGSSHSEYSRFIYDILFIGFFSIFFNNIVSGIMIDKFAELRDRKEKIDNEIRNKCYICSVDKPTLEKMDKIFQVHLSEVHNLWNYYFYLYHLERIKHQNDFTGIQYWIESKIKVEDISWFPSHDKYNDGSEHRIKALEDQLENMRKIMSKSEELK